ncbi:MAG: response regulator [Thaumarchaeota archaeon]|nr:response regulator [Nitrososphaerota archaeon]
MSNEQIRSRDDPILLVEDNPDDVLVTQRAWKVGKFQNELLVVEDGEKALQFLNKEGEYNGASRPILVLLDLKMPRVDGFEVLRQAKQDANLKSIPIIVLTTSDRENDVEKAFKLGCNAYLVKPVQFPAFIKTMLEVKEFWLTISTLPKPED